MRVVCMNEKVQQDGEMVACCDATNFLYTDNIRQRASWVLIAAQLSVVNAIAFSVQPQGLNSEKHSLQLLNKIPPEPPSFMSQFQIQQIFL